MNMWITAWISAIYANQFSGHTTRPGALGLLIMAGNSCPPYGSSLAEAWDPSRILLLKQRTGGVVPEVLNRPAMGCDPFGSGERRAGLLVWT